MLPFHFNNLQKIFEKLDTDKNGKISYNEFEIGILKLQKSINIDKNHIKQMFNELDIKNVGEIAFDELLNAAVHDYLIASDERLYEAFRELDDDEDGKITTEQLKLKLKESDPYGNYNDILNVIDDAKLDNNGQIDYEDFLRALHPDFNETPQWFWEAYHNQKEKENQHNNKQQNKNNNNNNDKNHNRNPSFAKASSLANISNLLTNNIKRESKKGLKTEIKHKKK
jgi:Ca2+-binding EF-hand superfamily protein